MLKSVDLHFTETGTLTLNAEGITIFVGPNNSGKSLVLREIETLINKETLPSNVKIARDYAVAWPDVATVMERVDAARRETPPEAPQGHVQFGRINPEGGRDHTLVHIDSLIQFVINKQNKSYFASQFMRWGLIRLDGRSRFGLTNDQGGGDLTAPPQNILSKLFQDDKARAVAARLIRDAFKKHFYVDPTHLGQLRIKLSDLPIPGNEQSLDAATREFFKGATHIKDASDGVQAFTGIVTAVLSGQFDIILIDEPEAFLHPPLARKLGKSLASIARERGGSLMASTHSADFLMGCVQESKSVQVVRLEYSAGKSKARSIDPAVLDGLLKRPLMRSANVISGLFHDGVIVCESDNDRAFYSEIYQRIVTDTPGWPSILFVNAQNKQTIKEIIGPLREFGIPAAGIPDIDLIKDGGKTWTDWLSAAKVPEALHLGLGQQRSSIKAAFDQCGKDMKTAGGVAALNASDRAAANVFFETLERFGIFTVRRGELESWLPAANVPGKKTDWAVAMLDRLGKPPSSPEYICKTDGDVWDFLTSVVEWIANPDRDGTD